MLAECISSIPHWEDWDVLGTEFSDGVNTQKKYDAGRVVSVCTM